MLASRREEVKEGKEAVKVGEGKGGRKEGRKEGRRLERLEEEEE